MARKAVDPTELTRRQVALLNVARDAHRVWREEEARASAAQAKMEARVYACLNEGIPARLLAEQWEVPIASIYAWRDRVRKRQ